MEGVADSLQQVSLSSSSVSADPLAVPKSLVRQVTIHGVVTDVWVQLFHDRTVLCISQIAGRVGHMMMCTGQPSDVNPKHVDYTVTSLLGARESPLLGLYARRITEESKIPVLVLGMGIQDEATVKDPAVFRTIVRVAVDTYRQAKSETR